MDIAIQVLLSSEDEVQEEEENIPKHTYRAPLTTVPQGEFFIPHLYDVFIPYVYEEPEYSAPKTTSGL